MNLLYLKRILEDFEFISSSGETTKPTWSTPPDLKLGLLTTNAAFIIAKKEGKNPVQIASEIESKLKEFAAEKKLAIQINSVGPYVNVDLENNFLVEYATVGAISKSLVITAQNNSTRPNILVDKIKQTVLIDYFNCNVAKKIHIGHIRSADIGESLRRILSLKYDKIITAPYLGDWGIQFSYLIWGLQNFDKLELDFAQPDLKQEQKIDLINKFYRIYVQVNKMLPDDEIIAAESKKLQSSFETYLKNGEKTQDDFVVASGLKLSQIAAYWRTIIQISLEEYHIAENYLNLNQGFDTQQILFNDQLKQEIEATKLSWNLNQTHQEGQFDLFIGESFYIPYTGVFEDLVAAGVAQKEEKAIYIDLENQKLGRCYLISSEGYSLYHSRDIIARFVWAGLIGADNLLSLADNRQDHSFKQVFAVIKLILDSGIYDSKPFGKLTQNETNHAIKTLKTKMAEFVGFGFMTLPDGAMSTRKGKIIAFEELREVLETRVKEVLSEKSSEEINQELIQKVAVASLKWVDLHRDRDQDVVFDFNQFLKFEGNTGVYQLYTLARLNSILKKNQFKLLYEKIEHEDGLDYKEAEAAHALIYNPKLAKYLIFEETHNPYAKTKFSLIGGKLENGETSEQALLRELEEETGISDTEFSKPIYIGTQITGGIFEPQHFNYKLTDHIYYIETENDNTNFEADGCTTRYVNFEIVKEHFNEKMLNQLQQIKNSQAAPPPFTPGRGTEGESLQTDKLNQDEILLLKTMAQLPLILEEITRNYKPHLLCTHLFELATQINSWYAKPENSVSNEQDEERKLTLLVLCEKLKEHMQFSLSLLAIDSVESL